MTACGKNQEDASGKVEIEFFNQKKEMTQTIQEIAKDFEAKNPDIHVKVVDVPNAGEVIKTRMLAGDVPDVINLYPQSIEFERMGESWLFRGLNRRTVFREYQKWICTTFCYCRIVYIAYH